MIHPDILAALARERSGCPAGSWPVAAGGCKSGLTVPFQIKGTTADPKFVPDVGGLAADMFKSKLGCVGGSSTAAGANPQANPVDAITGLFKKKKP